MKIRYYFYIILSIFLYSKDIKAEKEIEIKSEDIIERNYPLVKIKSPYFITHLTYNRDDNFLSHKFYDKFGINDCYVHIDIYENMKKLEDILKEKQLKMKLYDCFRPHEAQRYMWKKEPNPKYLSNPYKYGSLHSKGLAIDVALTNMKGEEYEFPTKVDAFLPSASQNYECKENEKNKCENRELLRSIMEKAGFRGIKNEWWHYQKKGDTKGYELIEVCEKIECNVKKEELEKPTP